MISFPSALINEPVCLMFRLPNSLRLTMTRLFSKFMKFISKCIRPTPAATSLTGMNREMDGFVLSIMYTHEVPL